MSLLRFHSVKWKIAAAVSIFAAVVSVVSATGFYYYVKNDYLNAIKRNELLVVSNLAVSAFESMLREDMTSIAFLSEQFARHPDVISVMVLDHENKVVFDSTHKMDGKVFREEIKGSVVRELELNDKRVIEIISSYSIGSSQWSSARVLYSLDTVNEEISKIAKTAMLVCLIGMMGGVLIATFIARWIARPIEKLSFGIGAIAEGDLDHRIIIRSGDEMEKVGHEFNAMAEQLKKTRDRLIKRREELREANEGLLERERELGDKNGKLLELTRKLEQTIKELEDSNYRLKEVQEELLQKEKMAAILELAGAAAHEMNQPLTVILGNIELLLSEGKVDDLRVRSAFETISRAARELAGIVSKIRNIRSYNTEKYVGDTRILDLDKSSDG